MLPQRIESSPQISVPLSNGQWHAQAWGCTHCMTAATGMTRSGTVRPIWIQNKKDKGEETANHYALPQIQICVRCTCLILGIACHVHGLLLPSATIHTLSKPSGLLVCPA